VYAVYGPDNARLRSDWFRLDELPDINGAHAASVVLIGNYNTSADPADLKLQDAINAGATLKMKVRYGDGRFEYLYLSLN